jgi:hypothetical protein
MTKRKDRSLTDLEYVFLIEMIRGGNVKAVVRHSKWYKPVTPIPHKAIRYIFSRLEERGLVKDGGLTSFGGKLVNEVTSKRLKRYYDELPEEERALWALEELDG